MKILYVAGFSPIVRDLAESKQLYLDALNLPLEGGCPTTDKLDSVKHLGLWALDAAAKSCFGTESWPSDIMVPQATIEFEVADVELAARELEEQGYELIHKAKTEPWKQIVARMISPDGLLVGLCHTPSRHRSTE